MGCGAFRALLTSCWVAAWLARTGRADTLDISVRLYRDANCFERAEELLLMDNACYANLYSNATRAFSMKLVGFNTPPLIDLLEYTDDCNTALPKRTITGGRCERLMGGFYGIFEHRFRSSTCTGDRCSTLNVVVQRFYSQVGCRGLAYKTFKYPIQSECMRWSNGTQTFKADSTFTNITQVDYLTNDVCQGSLRSTYSMTANRCYPLYANKIPRSFDWRVELKDGSTADAWRPGLTSVSRAAAVAVPIAMLGGSLSDGGLL